MESGYCVVLCTCPDDESARKIASALVEERLAACVNCVPGLRSTYVWEGTVQEDAELLLVIKTVSGRLAQVQQRVEALHPYELPEVIAVPIEGGSSAYLDWVNKHSAP